MKSVIEGLEQVANKVGILACLLVGWMYMTLHEVETRVEKVEQKTEVINEVKSDLSAIKAQLDLIIRLNKTDH